MSGLDKMKARILEEAQSTASQPKPKRQRSLSVRSVTRQITECA